LALFVFGQAYRASHHVLPDTPGIVSWHTLAQVGTTQEKGKPAPLFSAAVKALDHTRVNVARVHRAARVWGRATALHPERAAAVVSVLSARRP